MVAERVTFFTSMGSTRRGVATAGCRPNASRGRAGVVVVVTVVVGTVTLSLWAGALSASTSELSSPMSSDSSEPAFYSSCNNENQLLMHCKVSKLCFNLGRTRFKLYVVCRKQETKHNRLEWCIGGTVALEPILYGFTPRQRSSFI